MTNEKEKSANFIAGFFNWIREVIESAETPFVLFALIVLPVLAPAVPATVTGIRLHTELDLHWSISAVSAVVLELLGYVGAIAFIKSIYRWFRKEGSLLSVLMNGFAYAFYVYAMYSINVRLGFLAGENSIVNEVFAILSFLTIPTGLLAAEHINERDQKEDAEKLRQEARKDRMDRYKIKHGKIESSLESSNLSKKVPEGDGTFQESSGKSADWRKVRPKLSKEQLESIANFTPDQIRQYAETTHFTYKTISNWRANARKELGLD